MMDGSLPEKVSAISNSSELSMMDASLPEDVCLEIFSRLPAKYVGQARCLSKSWRTHLSKPAFIKLHLNLRKNQPENLLLIAPDSLQVVTPPIPDILVSRGFNLKKHGFRRVWTKVLGSCNGLVLLADKDFELSLINPVTKENVDILPLDLASRRQHDEKELLLNPNKLGKLYGFGYDSSTDDYKIVLLSYYVDGLERAHPNYYVGLRYRNLFYGFVDVYSVKSGVWRSIDTCLCTHVDPVFSYGAFVNGSIHWLSGDRSAGYPSRIVAFRLIDEVIFDVPTPPNVSDDTFRFYKIPVNRISVLGGCLCMINRKSTRCDADLWVMKEYGSVASWTSFSVDTRYTGDIAIPLCMKGDKEIVFISQHGAVTVYDLDKKRRIKELRADQDPWACGGGNFMESLVSPNQREHL